MIPGTKRREVDQDRMQATPRTHRALTPSAHLVLFFALAFGIAWGTWFVMRAAAIRPALGPNFSTSPGYLLSLVGIAGPTWAALLVSALAPGRADRRALVSRLLRWRVDAGLQTCKPGHCSD